jgi:ADP-ribose pyrophosphatase YjhB (NUDIX family)
VAAGALFLNGAGDVLLVHPTYKATWDIPGGYVERGESPAAACRRELREELGLEVSSRRLLAVDWAPADAEGDKLLFVFDCGPLADREAEIVLGADELDDWRWVPLRRVGEFLIPRLARRVTSSATRPGYLEHGLPSAPWQ